MEQTKVSIIVPVYKVPENYLRKCIESIMAQTMKDIEILLVDDGSPDNCGEICDNYAVKDSRIRVLHKKMEDCHRHEMLDFLPLHQNGLCLLMVMIGSSRICVSICIRKVRKIMFNL